MEESDIANSTSGIEAANKRYADKRLQDQITALRTDNERKKGALEKLARLGNDPYLGNSKGNVIAQQALKDCDARPDNTR